VSPQSDVPELSLVRFEALGARSVYYIVTNPLGRYVITSTGDIRRRTSSGAKACAVIISVTGALMAGAWSAESAPSVEWAFIRFLIFGAVTLAVVGKLCALMVSAAGDVDKDTRDVFFRISPSDTRAWRLCEIANAISSVAAWRDCTVDPDRRVATILWSAIGRSLAADRLAGDAERAATHPTLTDLADDARARAEHENDALDRVYLNLGKVLLSAKSIDQQRRDAARQLKERLEKEREAAELRRRLGGHLSMADFHDPNEDADRSAGVATEAEVVARLLGEIDKLLRDSD
jgi:hypothetical protein